MRRKQIYVIGVAAVIAVVAIVAGSRLFAPESSTTATGSAGLKQSLIATDRNHIAIKGYDAVAYFTDGKAVMGSKDFSYAWEDAVWQFANAQHRDMFVGNPEAYMPQYGAYCAASMANGDLAVANPEAWVIQNGKLYMFAGQKYFGGFTQNDVAQADSEWHKRTGQ